MAHFAKLGNNNIVQSVEVVHNDIATTEKNGADFLNNLYNTSDVWTLNDDTCRWEAPVVYPDDGELYTWNEDTTSWSKV